MTFYILEPSVYEFWHPMVSQNQCIYAPSLEARVDEIREELRKKKAMAMDAPDEDWSSWCLKRYSSCSKFFLAYCTNHHRNGVQSCSS